MIVFVDHYVIRHAAKLRAPSLQYSSFLQDQNASASYPLSEVSQPLMSLKTLQAIVNACEGSISEVSNASNPGRTLTLHLKMEQASSQSYDEISSLYSRGPFTYNVASDSRATINESLKDRLMLGESRRKVVDRKVDAASNQSQFSLPGGSVHGKSSVYRLDTPSLIARLEPEVRG